MNAPTPGSSRGSSPGVGPATPATLALDRARVPYRRHVYQHDPFAKSFGLEAADVLGVDPARVFKTLLVDTGAPGAGRLAVAVVPVVGQLDLKAAAAALGAKTVSMAGPAAAERSTGYVIGGISPIGQKRPLATLLDESAFAFETVYVSGGRRGFDVELAPNDLLALTSGSRADIRRS